LWAPRWVSSRRRMPRPEKRSKSRSVGGSASSAAGTPAGIELRDPLVRYVAAGTGTAAAGAAGGAARRAAVRKGAIVAAETSVAPAKERVHSRARLENARL
jgi:hypothetical protein